MVRRSTNKLSVLMLSWEFPPRIIGGISSHVYDLGRALARTGINVHVVTCDFPEAQEYEEDGGIHVYRFDSYIPSRDFLSWIFSMNRNMTQRAVEVIDSHGGMVDIIHAHDWLVAKAAIDLKYLYGKPILSTIHSTEAGRRGGLSNEYQRTINDVEKQLVNESSRVICCSRYMADQVCWAFGIPQDKVQVIPNGVDASKFDRKVNYDVVRRQYVEPEEKLVLFVGRLVHEKGVHVLIGAIPKVLSALPKVKLIIVGEGGMKEYLLKEAWDFGITHEVFFTGFLDEDTLISLYKVSDVCVVPSLYEPFGITALEAMAASTPVVASDTGGLSEIIEHDKTGVKTYPNNSDSLAWAITKLLKDRVYAEGIRKSAYRSVLRDYNWEKIAQETINIYYQVSASVQPKSDTIPQVSFPLLKFGEYSPEFRFLLFLQASGVIRRENAKSVDELSEISGMKVAEVQLLLQKLMKLGYVESYKDRLRRRLYYLTKTGIIKACSLFS